MFKNLFKFNFFSSKSKKNNNKILFNKKNDFNHDEKDTDLYKNQYEGEFIIGSDEISIIENPVSEVLNKINLSIQQKYQQAISTKDIAIFHQQALILVVEHIKLTEYGVHKKFLREIEYFVHYLFMIIQDDFFFGDKRLKHNMTQFDDYIFSQYRRKKELEESISKILALSYSNRFCQEPKGNLLSYFVFIEENGLELIALLEDFYKMLDATQKKSWFLNKYIKLHKNYLKKESRDFESSLQISGQTFMSIEPSFNDDIKLYKENMYNDDLIFVKKEKKNQDDKSKD